MRRSSTRAGWWLAPPLVISCGDGGEEASNSSGRPSAPRAGAAGSAGGKASGGAFPTPGGGSAGQPTAGASQAGGKAQAGGGGAGTSGGGGGAAAGASEGGASGSAPAGAGGAAGEPDGDPDDDELGGAAGSGGGEVAGSSGSSGQGDGDDPGTDPVEPPPASATGHQPFRVMTYNVRHPTSEDTGSYTWQNRKAAVLGRILANKPDIVGVQEASEGADKDLLAGLTGGGNPFSAYNPGGGSPKLIFYRTSRFAIAPEVGQGNLSLPNPYASDAPCHPNAAGRRAAWVGLRDLASQKVYLIINLHTAHAAACSEARKQAATAVKGLIDTTGKGREVIVMGDLNTDPQSNSTKDEPTIDILESAGLFRTSRHDGTTGQDDATFNSGWKGSWGGSARLDWILQSGGPITSSAPSVDRTEVGGLSPSDHFAVLATIRATVFEAGSTFSPVSSGALSATQLYYADVTGDGCADQLSWTYSVGGGETWFSKGNCQGGFGPPAMSNGATSKVASTQFFFADVNGDKCADKIFWRPSFEGGGLRVYPSKCDGSFGPVVVFADAGSSSDSAHFAFADVTGDGCADVVRWDPKAKGGAFETIPALCGATPALGAPVVSADGKNTSASTRVYLADVDGDGKADLLLWNPGQEGGKTRVYRSSGDGSFAFFFAHTSGTSGSDASRFYFADIDGDSKADKIFWRPGFREGRMQIYPSTGQNFAGSPLMDNTGFSNSEATRFFFARIDDKGGADKVYWNPGNYDGQSKVFRANVP